ncbi:MAG: gfo/Idh/MocA family oxidoreductase, partial [Planctomycetaceae bacterium]|nr:gfo/Idh/MocA family oxidoreductase [Planctomycetaceae bacterium]
MIMPSISRRHFLNTSGATLFATQTMGQAANSKRIKAAQIGTKHPHAEGKFTTMLDLDDIFEVVGLCEEDNTQRERVSTRRSYQSSTWLTEDQILGDPEIKLVAVET